MLPLKLLLITLMLAPFVPAADAPPSARTDGYKIIHVYPHDPKAFTQGLVYVDDHLYESTGLNGQSSLRMVDLETGRVLREHDVPPEYFAEGLTDWGTSLVQLTWKSGVAFVYDRSTFAWQRTLLYEGEGWGLTHDRVALIMSDGTSELRFVDPRSFREIRSISVHDSAGHAIDQLNELEYIRGEIYANIWHADKIVRISPQNGAVLGWIDLSGIINKSELPDGDAVLNGIAYDQKHNRLFVTGKLWPKLFQIEVVRH
jgi:glutaminyl-peptide cyclotransferase